MASSGGVAKLRRRRRGVAAAGVLLAAAAIAGLSSLRTRDAARAAHPTVSGRLELDGIERPVRIERDRHGVPHVEAATEHDAFFALGFSHAQDRLAQLIQLRRRARGTAAETGGPDELAGDRMARLIDFDGIAARQWGHLSRQTRRVLEAYAAGVNARIERVKRGEAAPPLALGAEPIEPWQPQDSLAVFKLFAWSLAASIDASLVLTELVETVGAADAERLFPPRDGPGRTGADAKSAARPTTAAHPVRVSAGSPVPVAAATVAWVAEGARSLRSAWGLSGYGVGSTAFAVGGAHTESGRPVLVADSHFQPTAPAALYIAHLRSPEHDVAGATLPGVPVFWWGRNGALAWASANAGAVVTDLYAETLRREGSEYHDGRRWRPLERRVEELRVRNRDADTLVVEQTSHGPLLPVTEGAGQRALSVAWTGARVRGPSGIGSLLGVARAGDGDAVRAALERHHEPPIALVWAEASGDVGLQLAGWIPRRTLAAQLLPLPGRARWYDWQHPVAFEQLPAQRLASGKGFVVAADQQFQGADSEAAPIDSLWRTGPRATRLRRLLADTVAGGSDLRELAALQTDVALDRSVELVGAALALLGDAPQRDEAGELAQLLRAWDGRASPDSTGAAAYHVFLDVLADALLADRLGADLVERYLALPALDLEALVLGILRDAQAGSGGDVWSEPVAVRRAVAESLREGWLALAFRLGPDPRSWRWGPLHALRFRGPGLRAPLGPFAYGGAPHSVLAGGYSAAEPFDVRVAATARFAIDASALDLALTALAPGQSEHPGHPHHDDGVEDWLAGRHRLLATRRLEVEHGSVAQLVLAPVR